MPVAPPRSDDAALLERLADVLDRRTPPPAPAPAPQPQRIYTDEEVAALQAAEKDYPDLMKAFQLAMRGQTMQNNAHLYQQIGDFLAKAVDLIGHLVGLRRSQDQPASVL